MERLKTHAQFTCRLAPDAMRRPRALGDGAAGGALSSLTGTFRGRATDWVRLGETVEGMGAVLLLPFFAPAGAGFGAPEHAYAI